MEVKVNKSRNPFSDRVMGSNNGADRVFRFIDFREEIEDRGVETRIWRREVLGRETMEGAIVLKEGIVVGIDRVIREMTLSGRVGEMSVSPSLWYCPCLSEG